MRIISSVLLCIVLTIFGISALAADFPPSSEPTIPGIDISVYNGKIDFASVKADGIKMIYIRSSLGYSYVDPDLARNADGAYAADIPFGFYHFCTASTVSEAERQANFFVETIAAYNPTLRSVLELDPSRSNLSRQEFNEVALAFLERVEKLTERVPAIYCSASTARDRYDDSVSRFPLWVADYGTDHPEGNDHWDRWSGFQYTSTGRINGIDRHVDKDESVKKFL